jgi:tetratricopeptide (TPR) repeat protein
MSSVLAGIASGLVLMALPQEGPKAVPAAAVEEARRIEEANRLYAQERYAEAAVHFRAALDANPARSEAHFYLAHCYDSLYRPARRGEAANDGYLQIALEHYQRAADGLTADTPETATLRKRSLQFLAALYGRDKLNRPAEAAPVLQQIIAMDPAEVGSYVALAKVYEEAGDADRAEQTLTQAQIVAPDQTDVWRQTAYFYNRGGHFDRAMDALARVTHIEPDDPQNHYQVAVLFEEKVRKDFTLTAGQQTEYLARGLEAVDMAIQLRPAYFEALVYKNLLLRQQARFETDPGRRAALLEEAEALQRRALAVREAQRGVR